LLWLCPVSGAGAVCVGVLVVVVEVDEDAAFASAAPPPASAPVTTKVISRGLMRFPMSVHLLGSTPHTILAKCRNDVGGV
jgi:hypothetical protein